MQNVNSAAGNRGEWSELYTLGYLLSNGGAYGADSDQRILRDLFYRVLDIFLAGRHPGEELQYKILENQIKISRNGEQIAILNKPDLANKLEIFFKELTEADLGPTFSLRSGSELMTLLEKTTISASSAQHSSDMELVFEDRDSKLPTAKVGFSIKSQVGNSSTLLNASRATNFIYKINPPIDISKRKIPVFEPGKVRSNVRNLIEMGYDLEFQRIHNTNFQENLELLDSQMPIYIAEVLKNFYSSQPSKFKEVVENTFQQSQTRSAQKIFKMKQLLGAIAMGLRPSDAWDGDVTHFKGLIVVKTDGDVVFYYLYNLTNFQEFLYNNVRFEVPSTSRHDFGTPYEENGEMFLKLNLQIRFIR